MRAYVPGEQPVDVNVIKLNTNENPYPPSPRVMQALAQINGDNLRRYPDPQCRKLRAVIAKLHNCAETQVFVGNGSDEILALCTRAFVEDNQAIAFFEPSYSLYPVLAEIRNVKSRAIKLDKNFSWPDRQWRQPPADAALFFMTNPNAPAGILYPKEEVAKFCRKSRGVVVLDEAYVDFSRYNCIDLALKLKNTLVLRTFSKSYSLAGLRLGYAIGAPELIAALYKIKDSYNVDRVAQELATAALLDQTYMRANVRRIIAGRRKLSSGLLKLNFAVFPSETNFVWVKPPGISAGQLYRLLCQQNIFTRFFNKNLTRDYLRITVGTDRQINILLKAVSKIIKETK